MPRNNILLQRLLQPPRVQLPNCQLFFAKYERVGRHVLNPTCVRTNRTYVQKISPWRQKHRRYGPRNKHRRRQQAGAGIVLLTVIDLGKEAAGSSAGQMVIKNAINALPTAYKKN